MAASRTDPGTSDRNDLPECGEHEPGASGPARDEPKVACGPHEPMVAPA